MLLNIKSYSALQDHNKYEMHVPSLAMNEECAKGKKGGHALKNAIKTFYFSSISHI
jgi:hypothetical protein